MQFRARRLRFGPRSVDFLILGLWTLAIVVGLILYSMPFFLIAMMIALAVGFPAWAALTVFPIFVIAMLYLFCVIASRRTRWPAAGLRTARSGSGVRTVPRIALPDNTASPADYYRNVKRLG
jgi:hypothetical protein